MEQLPPKPPIHNWPSFQFQMIPPSSAASNSWIDEFLDFSATRRNTHRRTVSDPIAFVEESESHPNHSNGFDGLDDEQLRNMFSEDIAGASNPSSTNPSSPSSDDEDKKFQGAEQHQVQPKDEPVEVDAQPMTKFLDDVSGDAIVDPKRIKRILANRQSAQRSRVRKLQYISELERSVTTLQTEVSTLSPRVAFLDHQRLLLNVDNSALKQRIAALAQDKLFKDAHQEALKKEIERLRNVYHEQNLKKMADETTGTANADTPPSGINMMAGCTVEE